MPKPATLEAAFDRKFNRPKKAVRAKPKNHPAFDEAMASFTNLHGRKKK